MIASLGLLALLLVSSTLVGCQDAVRPQLEQESISCMLKDNITARGNFLSSVKSKHGVSQAKVRVMPLPHGGVGAHKCFSQLKCPDTSVTWCFNLYHPTKLIEICWDSNNNILNMTEGAALLELNRYFTTGDDCRGARGPCIAVHATPFLVEGGALTCTSQNDTCTAKAFSRVTVVFPLSTVGPPNVTYHNSTNEMVIGQQNVYYFTVEVAYASFLVFGGIRPGISAIGIHAYDSQTLLDSIPENPFCDALNCSKSEVAGYVETYENLKKQRIRVYSILSFMPICPRDIFFFQIWLVIDNAQESDAGLNFTFKSSIPLDFFSSRAALNVIKLNLTAVTPIIDIVPLAIPYDVNSTTHNNRSTQPELGDSVQWSVSAQAGVGDRLVWTLNGQELPAVEADSDHEKDIHCSEYNNVYYRYDVQEVSQFVRNFSATLFLCNVSRNHSGRYECAVIRSRGDRNPIAVWSTQIRTQLNNAEPQYTATEQSQTTTNAEILVNPFIVTYIAVGVFILVLLVTAILILVLMVFWVRRAKRKRRFKSRRTSRRSDLVVQSFSNRARIDTAWNRMDVQEHDELEFPRERLVLLDKVLGNGTFGVVLLAKAEGIVTDSPDKNIVAVKTRKASAPNNDADCLWQELQIMRKIRPHPHIVNLLGYSRETSSSPLYLIVEFALYGSLQTFLKECKEVVLHLNHTPHIVHRNGRHQSCNSCTDSSIYANMSSTEPGINIQSLPPSYLDISATNSEPLQGNEIAMNHQEIQNDSLNPELSAEACCGPASAAVTHDYINSKGLLYMEDVHNFALQISSGLKHLAQQNIVHCDLAARNILITEGFVLKIGDFGMAKEMSEKEYYRRSEGRIPVKWTAPEALEEHVFSHKSDIWSLGVTLWEIFSYGHRPFSDVKIGQSWEPYIRSLKAGMRLAKPNGCPDSFYKLMQQCWRLNPDERPSASNLVHLFEACSDADSENYLTVAATDGEDGTHIDISDDDTSLRLEESVASCEIEPCTVEISDIENGEYQNVTNHTPQETQV